MEWLLSDLFPVALGATLAPIYPIIVLLLLQGKGGPSAAIAFVSGAVGVRLAQGVLLGMILEIGRAEGGRGPVASAFLLVLGLLLLVSAFRKWQKEEDPDAPSPRWMTMLDGLSGFRAVGAGAVLVLVAVKQWVFTIGAILTIGEFGSGGTTNTLTYLGFVLFTQIFVLPPIAAYLVAPKQAARLLGAARAWLERHNSTILIAVSTIFGAWFFAKGVLGLLGR